MSVRIRFADPERDAARILAVYAPYIERTAVTFETEVPGAEAAVFIFFEPEFAHRSSRKSCILLLFAQKARIYPDNKIFATTGIAI